MAIDPKTQALLVRIYGYANPIGWDCTPMELAEQLDVSVHRIGAALKCKPHWITRLRVGKRRIDETSRLDQRNEFLDLVQ